jgi:ubiquitin carboxyl-terminal hydrolase 34
LRNFDSEEGRLLFTEKIGRLDADYEKITMKALICIYQFFNLINESKGNVIILQDANSVDSEDNLLNVKSKVDPSKLYGVEVFWKIVQEASDKEVMEKSRDFLNRIYTQFTSDIDLIAVKKSFIETYLDRLAKTIDDSKAFEKGTLSKMIKLIEDTIEESERRGTGGVKSHISILRGNIINLLIKNELTSGEGIPKSMDVEAFGTISIWDLKAEVGKYVVSNPECMRVCLDFVALKDTDHGKILNELEKNVFGIVSVGKKEMPEVPTEPLLNEDKTLTEPAKHVFSEIFKKYSVDGKMSMHSAAEFLGTILDKKDLTPSDKIVKQFFKNLDKDRDNYLTLDDILQFYILSLSNEKNKAIKDHLHNHGYRNDLKKISEVPLHKVDAELLPRVLLSKSRRSFELLFKALDQWGSKADFAWHLLCRLCTNEEMYKKVKDIEIQWEDIINTRSSFRLLYCLQIVMGIFKIEELQEWKQLFISKRGFSFLTDIFVSKNLNVDIKTMEKYDKIALIALIKTINMFVNMAIFTLNKELVASYTEYLKLVLPQQEKQKQEEKEALLKLLEEKPSNIFFPRGYNKKPTAIPSLVITEEQASIILNEILNKELWKKQLNILADLFWNKPDLAAEDIKLGSTSITLLSSCLSFSSPIFSLYKSYTYEDKDFEALILFGLVNVGSQTIRTFFAEEIHLQCFIYKDTAGDTNILNYFLQLLLRSIIQRSIPREKSEEFFKLLCNLIDIHYKKTDKRFDINKLTVELIGLLKEEIETKEKDTMILAVGVIESIRKIVEYEPLLKELISIKEGVLNELFNNLLFATKEIHNDRKPASKKCYESALKLILTLCKDNAEISSILYLDYIDPLLEKVEENSSWAYDPGDESRSKFGYVGIRNLGCICYMISILQQFYMVPPFRYGILSIEDKEIESELQDEDLLYQLRFMFAFLESSERQAYNPKKFCNAYKDLDGYPTNTSIQQDAHEFLNMSFEKMENLISQTPQRYLVNGIFGGRICSQIICKGGCNNIRKNYEDFYDLSVEVKEFRTLSESLNKFVAGENITDYMCEHCNKKVNVLKRTSISELPNVLIIHLQRLVFNYDTLRNDKINSRLEFPKELSMEGYTIEGMAKKENKEAVFKEASYYHYKLAGVVVHVGFADAGHYYSFINTNRKSKFVGKVRMEGR